MHIFPGNSKDVKFLTLLSEYVKKVKNFIYESQTVCKTFLKLLYFQVSITNRCISLFTHFFLEDGVHSLLGAIFAKRCIEEAYDKCTFPTEG